MFRRSGFAPLPLCGGGGSCGAVRTRAGAVLPVVVQSDVDVPELRERRGHAVDWVFRHELILHLLDNRLIDVCVERFPVTPTL